MIVFLHNGSVLDFVYENASITKIRPYHTIIPCRGVATTSLHHKKISSRFLNYCNNSLFVVPYLVPHAKLFILPNRHIKNRYELYWRPR